MKLGIVVLYMNDMAKAKAFYTDIVGMTAVEEHSGPYFVTFRFANGSHVAIQDKSFARFAPGLEDQGGSVELSFEEEDVDGTWKKWKEKGVEILNDPVDMPFGRYFMAKDPEGHYLSVYRFK